MLNTKTTITVLSSILTLGIVTGITWAANDFCPVNTWLKQKPTLSKNDLTIGMFSKPEYFKSLVSYLNCHLKNVQITLVGDNKYSYQDAKSQKVL